MKILREVKGKIQIKNINTAYKYLSEFENEDKEYFIVLGLDTKSMVIYREIVAIGTLNQTIIHPREVFKRAIVMSANSIIIAHNHPSGNSEPSDEDIKVTDNLVKCGELLGIKVLDAIILGENEYYSLIEKEKYLGLKNGKNKRENIEENK
jgi:DNA repair protein RadC